MTSTDVTIVRGSGAAPPSLREDAARGDTPFQPGPLTTPSVAWDPYGEGGFYATDARYRWNPDARCYSMLCESCRYSFATWYDQGFAVCADCHGGGR